MKSTTKATLVGAILATASFMVLSPPGASQVPQQVAVPAEQYRVIDVNKFPNPQVLEQELNRLGVEGWFVVNPDFPGKNR